MTAAERKKAVDEVTLLSSLHHANIVAYKESFQERNSLYIVMEYVDGGDLEKKITQHGMSHFPQNEILFTFVQVLLPLAYLHERHILHRDLKPSNIFLTAHGVAKLGDFGVAKSLRGTADLARTIIGTPYYLAPEIWNSSPYNTAADMYSLGAVLYEMCALRKPYEGETSIELFTAVTRGAHNPIPDSYSPELRQLVEGMLSHDARYRPTAEQIKRLPIIQAAVQGLIEFNRTTIDAKPAFQVRKALPGRKRLLQIAPAPLATIKDEVPALQEVPEQPKEKEDFADDFIDDFEDDFIDDEDDDPFVLLGNVTTMLQESMKPAGGVPTWKFVKVEPRKGEIKPPAFINAKPAVTDAYKIESLRVELEREIGEAELEELYRNLQNEDNPTCKRFIRAAERKNKKAVQDVRNLIYLEQSMS
jgi:NIMA (never in mitosis gene a)-related kinase